MESWLELRDLVLSHNFIPLAISLLTVFTVGSGLWKTRWRKLLFVVALLAIGGTFAMGVIPHADRGHEWSEVLFNGQLL